jgi:hypothetical protein
LPCSDSPASDVAQRIDVAPWYGGLLQSERISTQYSARGFGYQRIFQAIRFLYALFSQLFARSANSGYFSPRFFSQHSAASRLKIPGAAWKMDSLASTSKLPSDFDYSATKNGA